MINLVDIPEVYKGEKAPKMKTMMDMIKDGTIIVDNLNPNDEKFKMIHQK